MDDLTLYEINWHVLLVRGLTRSRLTAPLETGINRRVAVAHRALGNWHQRGEAEAPPDWLFFLFVPVVTWDFAVP